jgi:hypothetical protein
MGILLLLDVNGDDYPDVISSSSHSNRLRWTENPRALQIKAVGSTGIADGLFVHGSASRVSAIESVRGAVSESVGRCASQNFDPGENK